MFAGFLFLTVLPAAAQESPLVAVASNFAEPMREIARAFEKEMGVSIRVSHGASGRLFAQISNGAPFDIFLSADQSKPMELEKKGLTVASSRFTYALGRLALVSAEQGAELANAGALRIESDRRIALANPALAPYGLAAQQTLAALQLESSTRPRWVLGENIAQTLQFVYTGNAGYGFVALSQLMREGEIDRRWQGQTWIVPDSLHQAIAQDAVLLSRAADCRSCVQLLDFLRSEAARKILAGYGYGSP